MSTWADIKAAWSPGWRNLAEQASRRFSAAVSSQPSAYADQVVAFQSELATSRASLDRIKTRLADPALHDDQALVAKVAALERRWTELAAGLYADATPTGAQGQPSVGVAPVLVVGGVAVTAVGVAWALGAYQYAVNLREQTALAERELDARIAASREGRSLQPSTLPAPQPQGRDLGLWLFGGLALVTGAVVLPTLLKR